MPGRSRSAFPAAILIILAGAALPAPALAQNALGDGTALDRNLRVGSGGKNVPTRDPGALLRFNNAIITGNVGGGKSFQGYVGYGAVGDFSGRLGTNDLYTFRRDSASGMVGGGLRGSDALRYQFSLATGQSLPPNIANLPPLVERSGSSGIAALNNSSLGSLRSTAQFLSNSSTRAVIIGQRVGEDGSVWNAAASPLTGVTWRPTRTSPLLSAQQTPAANDDPFAPASPAPVANTAPDQPGLNPGLPNQAPQIPGLTAPLPGTSGTPSAPNIPGQPSPDSDPAKILPPGERRLPLPAGGRDSAQARQAPVDQRVQPALAANQNALHSRIIDTFKGAFATSDEPATTAATDRAATRGKPEPTPADDPSAKPREPWEVELDRIRAAINPDYNRQGDDAKSPRSAATRSGDKPKPKPATAAGAKPTNATGDSSSTAREAKPDPSKADAPASSRINDPVAREVLARLDLSPRSIAALKAAGGAGGVNGRLTRLSDKPPNEAAQKSYDVFMQSGQELFEAAKYFAAEDRFTRAMAAFPGDPMAAIGRVHSQLGAGLFLSAGLNLRALIAEHPEILATKYAPNLIPTAERSVRIDELLRERLDDQNANLSRETALLLAYLGHLRENQAQLRDGLNAMRIHMIDGDQADANFYELVTKMWTDQ